MVLNKILSFEQCNKKSFPGNKITIVNNDKAALSVKIKQTFAFP